MLRSMSLRMVRDVRVSINVYGGSPNFYINGCMMALPDYVKAELGSIIKWMGSGGTYVLTLTSLANGSARMGVKGDLGATWDQEYLARLVLEFATAPAAGVSCEAYLAYSDDNTIWPAGVTGSDGAWPADGNEDEWAKQLSLPVAYLIATNDATTTVQVGPWHSVRPLSRYVTPVVDNNSGVAFHSTVANLRFEMVPKRLLIQDAA